MTDKKLPLRGANFEQNPDHGGRTSVPPVGFRETKMQEDPLTSSGSSVYVCFYIYIIIYILYIVSLLDFLGKYPQGHQHISKLSSLTELLPWLLTLMALSDTMRFAVSCALLNIAENICGRVQTIENNTFQSTLLPLLHCVERAISLVKFYMNQYRYSTIR